MNVYLHEFQETPVNKTINSGRVNLYTIYSFCGWSDLMQIRSTLTLHPQWLFSSLVKKKKMD